MNYCFTPAWAGLRAGSNDPRKCRFRLCRSLRIALLLGVGVGCFAQNNFVATYSREIGAPLDGEFRPSQVDGVSEAYLTPIDASSHAANLLLLRNGDLLCFWFSGTWEGNSGVGIVVSRLEKGSTQWSIPTRIDGQEGESYQNPVGFEAPDGTVWLFHTTQDAGAGESNARVLVVKSHDNGRTWDKAQVLFDKPGSYVRQPLVIMPNDDWLLPMYYSLAPSANEAGDSNYSAMKISSDDGKNWKECVVPESNGLVQPSVVLLGREYIAFFRSRSSDFIYRSTSSDGCAWTAPVPTPLPNNNSSIQAAVLQDGRLAMAFNNSPSVTVGGKVKAGPRRPLSVALSSDEGRTWKPIRDLEKGRVGEPVPDPLPKKPGREAYSYPAIVQASNGHVYVAFTYRRETIKVLSFTEAWLADGQFRR